MINSSITVLLLEDDESFSSVFAQIMQQKDHTVTWVDTLDKFYSRLKSSETFDLILMDLKLGNETSLSAINVARSTHPNTKIFMITAYASIATTVQAIKLGADDYLPKPFTVNDVLTAFSGFRPEQGTNTLSPKRLEWEYIHKV